MLCPSEGAKNMQPPNMQFLPRINPEFSSRFALAPAMVVYAPIVNCC